MKELLGWSLDGALDPWSCLFPCTVFQINKMINDEVFLHYVHMIIVIVVKLVKNINNNEIT